MKSKRSLITVVMILIVTVGAAYGLYQYFAEDGETLHTQPSARQDIRDFTVYDKNGEAVTLSDYKGAPLVINLWASWCGPCTEELPYFDRTARKYDGQVDFMMINLTGSNGETVQSATQFVEKNDYSFPLFFDTEQNAATVLEITSIPVTYFIDKDGKIANRVVGSMDENTLIQNIEGLL